MLVHDERDIDVAFNKVLVVGNLVEIYRPSQAGLEVPQLGGNLEASRTFAPVEFAKIVKRILGGSRRGREIRIILYFFQKNALVESNKSQPIGCSKRSCLACTLWIDACNKVIATNWMTSGAQQKVYDGR